MKSEELWNAIKDIDEELIAEAAEPVGASVVSIDEHRRKQKKSGK